MTRLASRSIGSLIALAAVATHVVRAQEGAARIDGTIRDSLRGIPLAGATVVAMPGSKVRDTVFHSVLSDATGHFSFAGLIAGRYKLSVEHPTIDSTGIGVPEVEVDAAEGAGTITSLGTPSIKTLRRAFCSTTSPDTSIGAMIGTVRTPEGMPISGAKVVFIWRDFDVDRNSVSVKSRRLTSSAISDANGVYRACELPLERPIYVQAQTQLQQSGVVQEHIDETGVLLRDFRIANALTASSQAVDSQPLTVHPVALAAPPRNYTVAGAVHRVDGSPVKGAQITLLGSDRTLTAGDDGAFRFPNVAAGTYGVEVIALGFFPRYLRAEIGEDIKPLNVQMERVAVVLDSLKVIARRTRNTRAIIYREFDERSKTGAGTFLTENDIANKDPIFTADVLKQVSGVLVSRSRSGNTYVVSTHGRTNFEEIECALDIFLDGRKMRTEEINIVAPGDLHGVEIHTTATAPARYHVGQCGAVFLWTK